MFKIGKLKKRKERKQTAEERGWDSPAKRRQDDRPSFEFESQIVLYNNGITDEIMKILNFIIMFC